MANTAKCTLTLEVSYDPAVTDPESVASAMDRLVETAMSTPDILDEYGNPTVDEFYVMSKPLYAIYSMATRELLLASFGLMTRRDVAADAIKESDARIADDLVVVRIIDVPGQGDDGIGEEEDVET